MQWPQVVRLLLLGVLSIGVGLFLIESYPYIPGVIATLTAFSYAILVIIIEIVIGREKLSLFKLGAVLLASAGMIVVLWNPGGAGSFHPTGILLAFLAALCNASYVVGLGSKNVRGIAPEIVTAFAVIPAVLFNGARCLVSGQPLMPANAAQLGYGLYIAVFSTVLAFLFFFNGIRLIGGSNAALVNMTEPLFAYMAGILLMADKVSFRAVVGGVMIILAIAWLNIRIGRVRN